MSKSTPAASSHWLDTKTGLLGQMDFEGQKKAEWLLHFLLTISGVVAVLGCYWFEDISILLKVMGAGVLLTCAVCLPAWSVFNRHPLRWQPVRRPSS